MVLLQIEKFGDGILQTFGAFGFIIIILSIVVWVLYNRYTALEIKKDQDLKLQQEQHDKEVESLQKRNNEISDKAMELMTRVSDKMPSLERIGNLERNHVDILKALDEILKKLDK